MNQEPVAFGISLDYNDAGSYELIRMIGEGQYSNVFKAKCILNDTYVAIKKITMNMNDRDEIEECYKEIRLLKHLNHPNVIKYLTSFTEENNICIVLEYADGGCLSQMIKYFNDNKRLIPEKSIWKFFRQIVMGLEHMHSQRVMHRDIKPDNILVTKQGILKLADLGFSRIFSNQTVLAFTTNGTPYYMSPERIDLRPYEFSSDIWSLGCILYEMAVLHSPFYEEQMNLDKLRHKISKCDYQELPSSLFTNDLRTLVRQCLSVNQSDRPKIKDICIIANRMYENKEFSTNK